jgi:hypothetical protein
VKSPRLAASLVIARRQVLETVLSPMPWLALALGLVLAHFLVAAFAGSIDTVGFDPQRRPVFDLLVRLLGGAFGAAFTARLFSEGPFLLALLVALAPFFLYLSVASVFRFGLEKSAGAHELLCYGPADGTAICLAAFITQACFSAAAVVVVLPFLAIEAAVANLVLGPLFLTALPLLFLMSLGVSAWGVLCSVVVPGAASALALFAGLMGLFLAELAGSFAVSSPSVRAVASVAAAATQWFSPFAYASFSHGALSAGDPLGFALGALGAAALPAALLAASRLAISRLGVRS